MPSCMAGKACNEKKSGTSTFAHREFSCCKSGPFQAALTKQHNQQKEDRNVHRYEDGDNDEQHMYSQRCRLLKLRLQLLIAEWCSDSAFSNSSILAQCAPLKPFQAKAFSHKWTWSSTWWPLSTHNVRTHKAAWWHARGCFGFVCFKKIKIIQMKDPNDLYAYLYAYYMATSSRRGHFDESSNLQNTRYSKLRIS